MQFDFSMSYLALWGIVIFQGLLALALLRQLATLRELAETNGLSSRSQLPTGSLAPEFAGIDERSGQEVGLGKLAGKGGILLFLSSGCSVCKDLLEDLRDRWSGDLPPMIAFCQGDGPARDNLVASLSPNVQVLFGGAEETAARYGVSGFPTAVIVDRERKMRGYGYPKRFAELDELLSYSLKRGLDQLNIESESPMTLAGVKP